MYAIQKGTVVEKLAEETANNSQHLRELINICEGTLKMHVTPVSKCNYYGAFWYIAN